MTQFKQKISELTTQIDEFAVNPKINGNDFISYKIAKDFSLLSLDNAMKSFEAMNRINEKYERE